MSKRGPQPIEDEAQAVGLAALVFLTEDADRIGRFLSETGLTPADLRNAAGTPDGLVAVLDHLLADESALLVFAAGASIDPATVAPAREVLAGGSPVSARRLSDLAGPGGQPGAGKSKRPSRRWEGPEK